MRLSYETVITHFANRAPRALGLVPCENADAFDAHPKSKRAAALVAALVMLERRAFGDFIASGGFRIDPTTYAAWTGEVAVPRRPLSIEDIWDVMRRGR